MPDHNFFINTGPFSLKAIAEKVGAQLRNFEEDIEIVDVNTLSAAKENEITFVTNSKYLKFLGQTKAAACIIDEHNSKQAPTHLSLLIHSNPHEAYAIIANLFYPQVIEAKTISKKASISSLAKIGKNVHIGDFTVIEDCAIIEDDCYIGANTTIGKSVKIGLGSWISNNCTITCAQVGKNCIIHPGARIGQDGFGFAIGAKGIVKVPQIGKVIIGNYVEIGSNSCIDRGALEDTVIGDNTKIDNLVQIGHNNIIGKSCIICGQVGIAGTSHVEDGVMLGGQVGIAGHLKIAAGSMVAAQSGVISDVSVKTNLGGSPATPIREWHRGNLLIRKLVKQGLDSNE